VTALPRTRTGANQLAPGHAQRKVAT